MKKTVKFFSLLLALTASFTWGGISSKALAAIPLVTNQQQASTCSGTVRDAAGEPIIGASIRVKGSKTGTVTDIEGNFTLSNVKKGTKLEISSIGFISKTVIWNGKPLNVTLEEDQTTLGEVVVTGYGGVQKAKTMTASAAIVNVGTLSKLPIITMAEGLGGRVTGVFTQQRSGTPGEKTKIWIRGGSNILYVIDDVVLDTSEGEDFFSRLRPDDIANMSVLKDAAATAVYGPRAANGVIVIQTKRGSDGVPRITLSQKLSIMTPTYRPHGMNSYDYVNERNEIALANYEETKPFNDTELSKFYMGYLNQQGYSRNDIMKMVNEKYNMKYSINDINDLFDPYKTQNGDIENYYSTYDPWKMFNHTQPMYQTNISVRGGSDRIKYYSSIGYLNQRGLSKTYDYKQYNIVINTDAYLLENKSLKLTFNANGTSNQKNAPSGGNSIFNSVMFGYEKPNRPAKWSTGLARKWSAESLLNNGFNNLTSKRLQINMALKWFLPWIKGLSATASLNYTTSYDMAKNFSYDEEGVYDTPYSTTQSAFNPENAQLYQAWADYHLTTGILQFDYSKTIGKHNFSAMVNYQGQVRKLNWSSQTKKGFATTLVPQLDFGATKENSSGSAQEWGAASWIGRITYDYDNKYMLQYSCNYNGSLSYTPNKRWGFFQAISFGWNMAKETWFKKLIPRTIVNSFKLRGGFGLVGNEVGGPFSYLTQYSQNESKLLLDKTMTSNVSWYISSVANNLQWSSSKQYGAGLDFMMFNNRLSGTLDTYLYVNKGDVMDMTNEMIRTDILGMPNIPKINAPFTTNKKGGFEIALNWQDKIGDFGYKVGLTYSFWDQITTRHKNKDESWYYSAYDYVGKRSAFSDATYWTALKADGLFGSWQELYNSVLNYNKNFTLGTIKINDFNGNGLTDDVYLTNKPGSRPLTQYGFTLGSSYKGLELELFFQGATNVTGTMPSPFRSQQGSMHTYGQYGFRYAYTPSHPDLNAALPLPITNTNKGWGYSFVDFWQFDASYLKLKNIILRYDLKQKVLKNARFIHGCDLSFIVTNAFTWTKSSFPLKDLQDPEFITTGASIYERNGTLGGYPTQRTYTFNVVLTL